MLLYLLKVFLLLIFSVFVGYNYYFLSSGHITNFDGYIGYIIAVVLIYGVYKYIQVSISKGEYKVSVGTIIGLFFANLLVLCFYFFALQGVQMGYGFGLFFKILLFMFLPVFIIGISTGFGKFLLTRVGVINKYLVGDNAPEKLLSGASWLLYFALGFIAFITLLVIFGIFGLYNFFVFALIFVVFVALSYKEIGEIFTKTLAGEFVMERKDFGEWKVALTEFFYLIAFIILGVGLISLVRPYPIGWDDLGVYMNWPHLMAENGGLLKLGGIYAWQVYTGIGYLFNAPTQSFFLNFSFIFLSFVVLNVILSNLLETEGEEDRKSFLNLPVIFSTIFVGLPMVGFHTKDMKLDEGLFVFTIIALFLLYKFYAASKRGDSLSKIYLLFIGIIVGFAFSIKVTALLLVIGILGVMSYARLGLAGFLGYLSIFFGVFTIGNFWSMMNIVINPYNIPLFEEKFAIISGILGIVFLVYAFVKKSGNFMNFLKESLVFLLGIVVILLPWFGKNISEVRGLSIDGLLSGKSDNLVVDYTKIYSQKEYDEITNKKAEERKVENLITTNEDMLRYFGYEKGILDYVNMFWNLTMQKNQGGEYTNIGWLFLALLPLIFIFLPYKKKYYAVFFMLLALIQIIFYATPNSKFLDNKTFGSFDESVLSGILVNNEKVFQNEKFNKDIYDIDVGDYSMQLVTNLIENSQIIEEAKQNDMSVFDYVDALLEQNKENLALTFYADLKEIVKNPELGSTINNFGELASKDFEYLRYLNNFYQNKVFASSNIVVFKELLASKGIEGKDKENLLKIWKESRTFSGKMVDFLAEVNIPLGYLYLFFGFLVPTLFLLFAVKESSLTYLFNLNLVFAFLYVFLWLISSFGIVWYGITMYFSFFLMIAIGAYYMTSSRDKLIVEKLIGVFCFSLIILVYVFYSLIPYIFSNLKNASYADFKTGQVSQSAAVFVHQQDYAKMIFELNIAKDKREEFFKETIKEETLNRELNIGTSGTKVSFQNILQLVDYDINQIIALLDQAGDAAAKASKENIYRELINPRKEFQDEGFVYRVGTFLLYYITENHKRVFGDSLLFPFDDYIYSDDVNLTVDRLKNLGFKHLLVDLNSATIDNSLTHDLTTRYEHLLETFLSPRLRLVSTDSICLQLALDLYKMNGDMSQYMTVAGPNYESYDEDGTQILRIQKKVACLNYMSDLLNSGEVDDQNYPYLIPYKNYFESTAKEINVNELNRVVGNSYRVLFEIK